MNAENREGSSHRLGFYGFDFINHAWMFRIVSRIIPVAVIFQVESVNVIFCAIRDDFHNFAVDLYIAVWIFGIADAQCNVGTGAVCFCLLAARLLN